MAKFESVTDLCKAMGLSTEVVNKLEKKITDNTIARFLTVRRTCNNNTIGECAKALNVSKRFLERLECTDNDKFNLKELAQYAYILGCTLTLSNGTDSINITELLKK